VKTRTLLAPKRYYVNCETIKLHPGGIDYKAHFNKGNDSRSNRDIKG